MFQTPILLFASYIAIPISLMIFALALVRRADGKALAPVKIPARRNRWR